MAHIVSLTTMFDGQSMKSVTFSNSPSVIDATHVLTLELSDGHVTVLMATPDNKLPVSVTLTPEAIEQLSYWLHTRAIDN